MKIHGQPLRRIAGLFVAALLWMTTGAARAGFSTDFAIGDNLYRDLYVDALSLDYNAGSSVLSITGSASTGSWTELDGGAISPFRSIDFTLTASFSSGGSILEAARSPLRTPARQVTVGRTEATSSAYRRIRCCWAPPSSTSPSRS